MDKRNVSLGVLVAGGGALLARDSLSWLVGKALDALATGMGEPVTFANFPWFDAIGLTMIASGLVIALRKPSSDSCAELAERMSSAYTVLGVKADRDTVDSQLMGELAAIFQSLERLRIPTPEVAGHNIREAYDQSQHYIGVMMPMIRNKQIAFARGEAPKVIEGMGGRASALPRWPWL